MGEQHEVRARAPVDLQEAVQDRKAHQGRWDQLFRSLTMIIEAGKKNTLRARDADEPSFYDEAVNPGALYLPTNVEAVKALADLQRANEREKEARAAATRAGVNFRDLVG